METFYIRPRREGGYGTGDGRSYQNAWNGAGDIDWQAVASVEVPTIWVCNAQPAAAAGVLRVFVEWEGRPR